MPEVLTAIAHGPSEPVPQLYGTGPAHRTPELRRIGMEAADVDRPAVSGPGNVSHGASTGHVDQQLGQLAQRQPM